MGIGFLSLNWDGALTQVSATEGLGRLSDAGFPGWRRQKSSR
jgi:hypothetical protein